METKNKEMMETQEHIKTKRLVYLYFLNVKISEPYHTVISRMFEFLEFDNTRDVVMNKDYEDLRSIQKFNKDGKFVCSVMKDKRDKTTALNFGYNYDLFLKGVCDDCYPHWNFDDNKQFFMAVTDNIMKRINTHHDKIMYSGYQYL